MSIPLSLFKDVITNSQSMSADKLHSLRTLAFSDNVDLQKSAALCFSEISDTCELCLHVYWKGFSPVGVVLVYCLQLFKCMHFWNIILLS